MGMYTELVLNIALADELDKDVVSVLKFMTDNNNPKPLVGDHAHFKTDRWEWMLLSASFYFVPDASSKLIVNFEDQDHPTYHLSVRCDLKNYTSEIECFLDWLAPHVETYDEPVFGGYMRYEEDEHPTLLYFTGGKVEYRAVGE